MEQWQFDYEFKPYFVPILEQMLNIWQVDAIFEAHNCSWLVHKRGQLPPQDVMNETV